MESIPNYLASTAYGQKFRTAPGELSPLPSRWVKNPMDDTITLSSSNTVIDFKSDSNPAVQEVKTLKTDRAIPINCGIYYFEIDLQVCLREVLVSVGFCTSAASLHKLPGLETGTWGYHSDDGKTITYPMHGVNTGPTFGRGDTIGCGLDLVRKCIFYTKNGILLSDVLFDNITKPLTDMYPCVGFRPSVTIGGNFGQSEFAFDINLYVGSRRDQVVSSIKNTPLLPSAVLAEAMSKAQSDEEVKMIIKKFVASYFSYLGYIDSAKAFKDELQAERSLKPTSEQNELDKYVVIEGDEVIHRQKITVLISQGDIDEGMNTLQLHFPQVLDNSLIIFKLECCKFVELVRASIQDETAIDNAIAYGQELRTKYKSNQNPFVTKKLSEAFSLLAYTDPESQDPSVSYLLNPRERIALAEEVNAEILIALGKPGEPPLQRLIQHIMALVAESQSSGRCQSDFVDVKADFF